jgi:class 3 adenylate cyclase
VLKARETGWTSALVLLCVAGFASVFACGADVFGLGGRAWFGYHDQVFVATGQPFVVRGTGVIPGGAASRAGLQNGDLFDLREQTLDGRVGLLLQYLATRPTMVSVHRGPRVLTAGVVGTTVWEINPRWKLPSWILSILANCGLLGCAVLIALRRAWMTEARVFALVLLCYAAGSSMAGIVVPDQRITIFLWVVYRALEAVALLLLVALTSRFGTRSAWRRSLEWLAYAAIALDYLGSVGAAVGMLTLWIDPWPFMLGSFWSIVGVVAVASVILVAAAAVASTPSSERPRSAWLLLPLPITYALVATFSSAQTFASSWFTLNAMLTIGDVLLLLGAIVVTYALLNRRVLDFGFVLGRTIIVSAVALIVVAIFILLEWILGTLFAGADRNAWLYVSGAVTLVLGLSMPKLYTWISAAVERHLFARDYRARMQVERLAAGLPYAEASSAIAATLTSGVCRAFNLPSAIVYRRTPKGGYVREAAYGWTDAEGLQATDAQRLAMDLQGSHSMLRIADEQLESGTLPSGDREPAVAFPLFARHALVGYVLYSARLNGVDLDPDDVRLLNEIARGASRGYDAVELASRVESAYQAKVDAQSEVVETVRRSAAALERVNEAQARFMPSEFLLYLGRESIVDVALGDSVLRRMTVLFSDIRSFTTISEGMSPPQIFAYLNRYLHRAGPVVSEHGGFIDKYVGDAVMGLFPKSADGALEAGIDLQREVRVLNRKLVDEGLPALAIGVGLHTGDLILGTIGERNRMETTVIGDAVNAASRLEGATKTFGCSIVLSREARNALSEPDRFMLRYLGTLQVKGKSDKLEVYEAFDADPSELIVHKQNTMQQFGEALAAFEGGDFTTARGRSTTPPAATIERGSVQVEGDVEGAGVAGAADVEFFEDAAAGERAGGE